MCTLFCCIHFFSVRLQWPLDDFQTTEEHMYVSLLDSERFVPWQDSFGFALQYIIISLQPFTSSFKLHRCIPCCTQRTVHSAKGRNASPRWYSLICFVKSIALRFKCDETLTESLTARLFCAVKTQKSSIYEKHIKHSSGYITLSFQDPHLASFIKICRNTQMCLWSHKPARAWVTVRDNKKGLDSQMRIWTHIR